MNKLFKFRVVFFYSLFFYFNGLFVSVVDSGDLINKLYIFYLLCSLCFFIKIIIYIKINSNFLLVFKVTFITIFLALFFFVEEVCRFLFLHGLDGNGYLQESGLVLYENSYVEFSWTEKLYWQFVFYFYYPIYIFIFFIPLANFIDGSINNQVKKNDN